MVVKNVCKDCGTELHKVGKIDDTHILQCPKCKNVETLYAPPPRLPDCDSYEIGGFKRRC